jgi:hypothetical protein
MRALRIIVSMFWCASCGGGGGSGAADAAGPADALPAVCNGVSCSGHGGCFDVTGSAMCQCDPGYVRSGPTTCVTSNGAPALGGCAILPADHIFNTPINALPTDTAHTSTWITTIGGSTHVHLDLGTTTDPQSNMFWGIPYDIVQGSTFAWSQVAYTSTDTSLNWDPKPESDCASGASHTFVSPCTTANASAPLFPIPASPIIEGGINMAANEKPYGDHHLLLLDADTCRLWELYHVYEPSSGTWNIFGSASFDLNSDALRPDGWSSADAAGFPILPLLLKASEASSGTIKHALRFTIDTSKIRTSYIWPARHLTTNGTSSTTLPQMGQLFRLKASYPIPAGTHTQSLAIMQAMQTYGMYIADGGSDMYVTGEPSAAWDATTFAEVQQLTAADFEAVDISSILNNPSFDPNSAKVP